WRTEKVPLLFVNTKQVLDALSKSGILAARLVQVESPRDGGIDLTRHMENGFFVQFRQGHDIPILANFWRRQQVPLQHRSRATPRRLFLPVAIWRAPHRRGFPPSRRPVASG